MSLKERIKEANDRGEVYVLKDPAEAVVTLPDGRTVLEIFMSGKFEDTNMKTSRYIGVGRSEPAVLLKPLKYVTRGPKGGIKKKGTFKAGEAVRIMGWPGFTDKEHCDLIVLHGDDELPKDETARDELHKRVIECSDGFYINLEEGVDYEYTGKAPMSAAKTSVDVITCREIEYLDEFFCEGSVDIMTSVQLCTQFGETFLEFEGTRIMDNPVEDVDYV